MERGPTALFWAIVAVGLGPAMWLGVRLASVEVAPSKPPAVVGERTSGPDHLVGGTGAGDSPLDDPALNATPRGKVLPLTSSPSPTPSATATTSPAATTSATPSAEPSTEPPTTPPTESTTAPTGPPTENTTAPTDVPDPPAEDEGGGDPTGHGGGSGPTGSGDTGGIAAGSATR